MKKKKKDNIKRFINNINKKLILGNILKPSGSISATGIPIIAAERACICSKKPSLVRTGNPHFHDREFFDSREPNIDPSHFANPASETILLLL
jgi:hypothetical protein